MRVHQEQEYGLFVEAQLDRLLRFGYLLCGDWHLAEDAVQNALTKLYVVWPRVSRLGEVDPYVRSSRPRTTSGCSPTAPTSP
ncbi:MAG: hypothetical protein WCA46_30660 [Actinocatenispora sp.]